MAKPTKEQEVQVTKWFMETFWSTYPSKYCRGGKGSRGMALVSMLKVNPDKEEQEGRVNNLKGEVR